MVINKRERLTAQLPPTPCTPGMREHVFEVAKTIGISVAELQRNAVAIFLARYSRETIVISSTSSESELDGISRDAIENQEKG